MAGVIGIKKLSYHLFGDTINTGLLLRKEEMKRLNSTIASRMCSHGTIQRIHVSESTYKLLSTKYNFEPRGEILVKGKGAMTTYYLDRRKGHPYSLSTIEKEVLLKLGNQGRTTLFVAGVLLIFAIWSSFI